MMPSDAERTAADQLSAYLEQHGATDLHTVVTELPPLKTFLQVAPLRLVPFCQLFPDRFVLEPDAAFTQLRVRLRLEQEPPLAAEVSAAAAAAVEARFIGKLHQYHQQWRAAPG